MSGQSGHPGLTANILVSNCFKLQKCISLKLGKNCLNLQKCICLNLQKCICLKLKEYMSQVVKCICVKLRNVFVSNCEM